MKNILACVALVLVSAIAGADSSPFAVSLNGAWEFRRVQDGANVAWQTVTVPHDWAIAGPFETNAVGRTGKLPWRGRGEYRKAFELTDGQAALLAGGGKAYLEFDGVMASPKVTLNGVGIGGWDYGYMSFRLDATAAIRPGANLLEVTCHTLDHNSRWYPGAGVYRDVRLKVLPREHVVPGTLRIVAKEVTRERATVCVDYESSVAGPVAKEFAVVRPRLWDVDDPHLYELEILGERFRYGIRTCAFTADDGFHLNGRRVDLRGVNNHSDLGPLGMAFDRDAAKRQLLLMKDMGVNALRTSHNAPAPQLLDLCDELGVLVWDECFDKWNGTSGRPKGENLEAYVERNLRAFAARDRNHPSVVVWSIGNEIQVDAEGMSRERFRRFRAAILKEDATRAVGIGACVPAAIASGMFEELDVVGWNYRRDYKKMRDANARIPLVCSESASAVSSYGHYESPLARGRVDFDTKAVDIGGYDHCASWGADIADVEFLRMETDRYCAGEFVWTGIDYLGEPTPWSSAYTNRIGVCVPESRLARSSYFGAADLTGFPKDRYYLYRSHWKKDVETVHVLPHWNWEGGNVPVYVYTSGDEAELFLNGRSLGRRRKQPCADYSPDYKAVAREEADYLRICDRYRLRWLEVPYEPGELKAVAYRQGVKIGEETVRTAGAPAAVALEDDPYNAPEAKTRFVRVSVVDAKGTLCPRATNRMRFRVKGAAKLLAVGNGDAKGLDSFAGEQMPLYYGRAMAVVRVETKGAAVLVVETDGLPVAELTL